jgi:PadR family transcriptional regulator PadR
MFLGEFEQMVLIACVHLGDDAYGVSIVDEIERRTGRQAAHAAVYVTLRRLEQKGLLESWKGEPTAERGGKARRHVKLTKAGTAALRQSRHAFEQMWRGLDGSARRLR